MCSQKREVNTEEFLKWHEDHEEFCVKNHEGSAGKMEVDSVLEMFKRSEEKFGVRYCILETEIQRPSRPYLMLHHTAKTSS